MATESAAPTTSPSSEIAVREGVVITPAERARAVAGVSDLDAWLIVMKDVIALSEHIAYTNFVPKAIRGNPAAVAAAILAGRELALPPMTALRHVQVVEGTPGLSAEYKRARVLAAGHRLDITEHTTEACTVTGHRKGHEPVTVRYTIQDARRAGLVKDKGAYMTRPRRMLFARASTEVIDALFADLTNGLATTELLEEELEAETAPSAASQPERPRRPTAAQIRQQRKPEPVEAEVVREEDVAPPEPPQDPGPADGGLTIPLGWHAQLKRHKLTPEQARTVVLAITGGEDPATLDETRMSEITGQLAGYATRDDLVADLELSL